MYICIIYIILYIIYLYISHQRDVREQQYGAADQWKAIGRLEHSDRKCAEREREREESESVSERERERERKKERKGAIEREREARLEHTDRKCGVRGQCVCVCVCVCVYTSGVRMQSHLGF
jgi:hypothetical protein